jgi:hypothetical protein
MASRRYLHLWLWLWRRMIDEEMHHHDAIYRALAQAGVDDRRAPAKRRIRRFERRAATAPPATPLDDRSGEYQLAAYVTRRAC